MSSYSREQLAYAQALLEHCAARRYALPDLVFETHDKAVSEMTDFMTMTFWQRLRWFFLGA